MDFLEPQSLANAALTKVHCIRQLIEGYEAELPSGTCAEFVGGIKLILQAVEDYHREWVEYLPTAWPDNPDFRLFLLGSTSRIALAILRNIEREHLPLLRASLLQSPYLLKQMLERVIAPFRSTKKIELTLIPTFDYLYGFTGILELAKSQVEKLGTFAKKDSHTEAAADLPDWTVFLSFPIVEHGSALNQIVLAHELAHLIIHLKDLPSKLQPFTLDTNSFNLLVQDVNSLPLRQIATPLSSQEQVRQHCYEVCSEMVTSWMQEVMADLIAVHALGPAYHLAFLEFLAHSSSEDVPDRVHPAPSYRCSRVLEELSYLGYSKVKTGVYDAIWRREEGIQKAAAEAVSRYEKPERVAHATVELKLPDIRTLVREFCSRFSYKASQYNQEVNPLVASLVRGLVPMNAYRPAAELLPLSPVAILNAGTESYATQWSQFEALFVPGLSRAKHLQNLNGLIFKSLELNEVVRRFYS